MMIKIVRNQIRAIRARPVVCVLGVGIGLYLYPIVLMCTVGRMHQSGSFDAALILGARVYADGSPSDALLDRTIAACELYHDGVVENLILSGGPGDGGVSEPEAMRRIGLDLGVPEHAMVLDQHGLSTAHSAANVKVILEDRGWTRVVASTHFYHTPRTQIALNRIGLDGDTHPASMRGHILFKLPIFMMRESIAWWAYVLGLK